MPRRDHIPALAGPLRAETLLLEKAVQDEYVLDKMNINRNDRMAAGNS